MPVKNLLHGTWLGHPLHAAVTDVPIGFWSTAFIFDALDLVGRDNLAPGADAAIALGVVGALASAATGLTDGRVLAGPAVFPQPHFETRVRDGQIEVRQPQSSNVAVQ